MGNIKAMPYRRRRKLFDLSTLTYDQLKTLSKESHRTRTGHYPALGGTLVNYKPLTTRRDSPVMETIPKNKILVTSKAMPYRRTYRRRSQAKRRFAKRRSQRIPPPIPRTKLIKFRTCTQGTLTGTNGAIATNVTLKANSLNDPTGDLSTYLPQYLDQMAALYKQYIVLGSKIKLRITPTTITGAGIVGIHLADNNTALTSSNNYKMQPRTKQIILTTQNDLKTLVHTYSAKKFWSLTNIKDDSEQEASLSTTPGDPTDVAYWHIYCQDLNATNTLVVEFQVEIEHICLLKDPVQVAVSDLA